LTVIFWIQVRSFPGSDEPLSIVLIPRNREVNGFFPAALSRSDSFNILQVTHDGRAALNSHGAIGFIAK
jgi:hypothetical protein